MDLILENCYIGYLNMDHREDRYGHMNNQLSKAGIQAIRHRGKRPEEYDLTDPKVQVMLNRTPGAIACQFGQMEIMKRGLEDGRHAIVFEDDIIICSDFQRRFEYISEWSKTHDWDIVWLGGTFHVPAFWHRVNGSGMPPNCSLRTGHDCESTDDPRMVRTFGAFSTYAYIVNHNSIETVLQLLDGFMHRTIGVDFSFIALGDRIKSFSFVPGCVKQIDNLSDIGSGMTIFSGFSRLNGTEENSRYWFQDKMEMFNPSTFNFDL